MVVALGSQILKKSFGEYHEEADSEVKHTGKYATAKTYGDGEQPDSVLAALIRRKRESGTVAELRDEGGDLMRDPTKIADRFSIYYADLYSSKVVADDSYSGLFRAHTTAMAYH